MMLLLFNMHCRNRSLAQELGSKYAAVHCLCRVDAICVWQELQRQGSADIVIGLAGNKADLVGKRKVDSQVGEWNIRMH